MIFLISIMSFANFVFYPLVIGTLVAVVIEQIFRARGKEDNPEDVRKVMLSMGVRKYLYRQAWIFNIIWFVGYIILMFTVGRQQPAAMPDMIWQG
jgi:preprotein translocase subunit SecG